jgi:hypothetical protein
VLALLLLATAAYIGASLVAEGTNTAESTQLETAGKVLVLVLSGVGALYVIDDSQRHARELQRSQNEFERQQLGLRQEFDRAQAAFRDEVEARHATMQAELEAAASASEQRLRDAARSREELRPALLGLSRSTLASTDAFRRLVQLPQDQPEALVNTLAEALKQRSEFLRAIKKLKVLQAIEARHSPVLKSYSTLLIDIIIDVRRETRLSADELGEYGKVMEQHAKNLEKLNHQICAVLRVLLAP